MREGPGHHPPSCRFGTLTWPDGDSYVGAWAAGLRQGWGAYYWNNGNSYQVTWPPSAVCGSVPGIA